MSTRATAVAVTLGVAVPAFFIGPVVFPPAADWPTPIGVQLALLVVVAVIEALAFGAAIAFLALGWPLVRRIVGPSRPRTVAAYLATAWVLGNWWLHDNLHLANGVALNGLIAIEYAFHTTLIVAGAILAWQLLRSVQNDRLPLSTRSR